MSAGSASRQASATRSCSPPDSDPSVRPRSTPAQAQPVQRRLHTGFRGVALAQLVLGLQAPVRLEFVGPGRRQPVLQPFQLGFHLPQRAECIVDGVGHGQPGGQPGRLRQVSHPAVPPDRAVCRRLDSRQDPQQGGLAGTVLTDDGGMLPGSDHKVDAGEEFAVPVAVGDAGQVELFGAEIWFSHGKSSQSKRRPRSWELYGARSRAMSTPEVAGVGV